MWNNLVRRDCVIEDDDRNFTVTGEQLAASYRASINDESSPEQLLTVSKST